jgi:hypothetical protein
MSTDNARNVLSSLLAESLIGDRADPTVLASSILVGEVRKCDLDTEFEDSGNKTLDEFEEAEGIIGQLVERIVSSIRATITNTTLRFEFPSETEPHRQNLLLLHFPRLDYADETPMPSGNDTWQPSIFIYKFNFKGFIVQLFDEEMSASVFGKDSFSGDERYLDEGNTVIYGETGNNQIRIKITTNDSNKTNNNNVELSVSLDSIHSVITPKRIQIMLEILTEISNKMTSTTQQNFAPVLSRTHVDRLRSMAANDDSANFDDIIDQSMTTSMTHVSNLRSLDNSTLTTQENTSAEQFMSIVGTSTMYNSSKIGEFKAVEEYFSDEESFYSASSNDKEEEEEVEEPSSDTRMADIRLSHMADFNKPIVAPPSAYLRNPTFVALEQYSSPISFQIVVSLKGATINLLYQDANLTQNWKKFMASGNDTSTDRVDIINGPVIPVDHISLQVTQLTIKSQTNQDRNEVEMCLGKLGVFEKLLIGRKRRSSKTSSMDSNIPQPSSSPPVNRSLSMLSSRIVYDHFGESAKKESKSPPKVEREEPQDLFAERCIIEFLSQSKGHDPQVATKMEFNRKTNSLNLRVKILPMQLNLDLGLIGRLVNVLQNSVGTNVSMKSSEMRPSDSTLQSDIIVTDIDSDLIGEQVMTTLARIDIAFVRIMLTFPIISNNITSKFEYQPEKLCLELEQVKVTSDKIRADAEVIIFNVAIDQLKGLLMEKEQSQITDTPPILKANGLKLEIITRKTQKEIPPSVLDSDISEKKKKKKKKAKKQTNDDDTEEEEADTRPLGIYPPIYEAPQDDLVEQTFKEIEMSLHSMTSSTRNIEEIENSPMCGERGVFDTFSEDTSDSEDDELEDTDPDSRSSIFAQERVGDMLNLYSSVGVVDQIVSDQKVFKSAGIAIVVNGAHIGLIVSKTQMTLLQRMLQDLSKFISEPFATLNVVTYEQSHNKKHPEILLKQEAMGAPDVAVKLAVHEIDVTFLCAVPSKDTHKQLKLTLGTCTGNVIMFSHSNSSSTLQVRLQSNRLSLDEIDWMDQTRPIIRRFNRLVKPYEKNSETAFMLNLNMRQQPWDLTTQVQTAVSLHGLYAHLYFDPTGEGAIDLITQFFTADEPAQGTMITSVSVTIRDSCIDYSPINLSSRLLLTFDRFEMNTPNTLISTTDPNRKYIIPDESKLRFELNGLYIWLHDKFQDDIVDMLSDGKHKGTYSEFGFLGDLKNLGFIQIGSLSTLKVEIKTLNEGVTPTREKPTTLVQISDGTLIFSCCHDSLATVIGLVRYISAGSDIPKKDAPIVPVTTTQPEEQAVNISHDFEVNHFGSDTNLLGNISDVFSNSGKTPAKALKTVTSTHAQDISNRNSILFPHLVSNYIPTPQQKDKKRERSKGSVDINDDIVTKKDNYEFALKQIIEAYFPLHITEDDSVSRVLSPQYSAPTLEIVISQDVDICLELYGGEDHVEDFKKRPGTRDQTKSIRVNIRDCFIQYDLFPDGGTYVNRTRVSFKEIEILDKLKQSNRNKIVTEWKSEEMPREDGARMLDLVIESVRPEPNVLREEMRISLDLLPLRINVHQETLIFLLDFFKAIDSPSSENDDAPSDIYFQSLQTSEINIKVDYQPTSLSLSKIKDGEYFELLNLTSINGMEVRLHPLDVHGQSGVSNLVDAITTDILPQVTGTQVFRFMLGIMPIRSLYNVGSGVADLVVLPIQQYNRDGQILRGLRRGITSFVSNLGVETVNLSATGFQIGNYAFESVGNLLSTAETYNTENEMVETPVPSNLNDGLQKAYNEIERGLSNAKCAIIAIPREYERSGSSGAASSLIRALLVTPSRALQGATGAVTHMLYGLRGELDPQSSLENEQLYKM